MFVLSVSKNVGPLNQISHFKPILVKRFCLLLNFSVNDYPAANLSSPTDRTAWIQKQVVQAKEWRMDGINFDIEYKVSPEHAH